MLNTFRVVPFGSKYPGPHQNGTQGRSPLQPTAMATIVVPTSTAPAQDDVYTLLRERMELHTQLSDAVQIQRKLSGPRLLRCGEWEFAREVFAARFLSGDFATFSQDGAKVL